MNWFRIDHESACFIVVRHIPQSSCVRFLSSLPSIYSDLNRLGKEKSLCVRQVRWEREKAKLFAPDLWLVEMVPYNGFPTLIRRALRKNIDCFLSLYILILYLNTNKKTFWTNLMFDFKKVINITFENLPFLRKELCHFQNISFFFFISSFKMFFSV